MTNYNHQFSIAFEVKKSNCPNGNDITSGQLREAILARLAGLTDDELREAVGWPLDSYEDPVVGIPRKSIVRFECGQEDRTSEIYELDFIQFTYASDVRTIRDGEEVLIAYFGKDGMWHNEFDGQVYSDIIIE